MKTEKQIKAMLNDEIAVCKLHEEEVAEKWVKWQDALAVHDFDAMNKWEALRSVSANCKAICEGRIEILSQILGE